MVVFLVIVAFGILFAVVAVAMGRGDAMVDFDPDRPPFRLPEGPIGPSEIAALRIPVGLRGYRMDHVDEILDRLGDEIAARDERIAVLEQRIGPEPVGGPDPEGEPGPAEAGHGPDGPAPYRTGG